MLVRIGIPLSLVLVCLFSFDFLKLAAPQPILPNTAQWEASEHFTLNGSFESRHNSISDSIRHHPDLQLWGSWSGSDDWTGTLKSPPFRSGPFLGILVCGYPGKEGNDLHIENTQTGRRLHVDTRPEPGEKWKLVIIPIPGEWRDQDLRLAATDGARGTGGWLGVGTPLSIPRVAGLQSVWMSYFLPLQMSVLYLAITFLFLALGIILTARVFHILAIPPAYFPLVSIGTVSLIGYATFWSYFSFDSLGRLLSITLTGVTIAQIAISSNRHKLAELLRHPDIGLPLSLMLMAGFFYLTLLYGVRPFTFTWNWPEHAILRFGVPTDNLIPREFVQRLYHGRNLLDHFFGDWLSSDRPPLQAGLTLIQYPIWSFISRFCTVPNLPDLYYEISGIFLQCSWVPASWLLLRHLKIEYRRILLIILTLIPSGFFFFNSVYIWPKMIAGAFGTTTFCLLLQGRKPFAGISTMRMALASGLAALGLLAHGSCVFSLMGFALVLLLPRYFIGWKNVGVGLLTVATLYAPWAAYQKYYDPPGNRLLKWHLAFVVPPDQRTIFQTLRDTYSDMSPREYCKKKLQQMRLITGLEKIYPTLHGSINNNAPSTDNLLDKWRRAQYVSLLPGLDLLNIGWLVPLWMFVRSSERRKIPGNILFALAISTLSMVIWFTITLSPTFTFNNSYTTVIMLYVLLAALISSYGIRTLIVISSLSILNSLLVWGFTSHPAVLIERFLYQGQMETYRFDLLMLGLSLMTYLSMFGFMYVDGNSQGCGSFGTTP